MSERDFFAFVYIKPRAFIPRATGDSTVAHLHALSFTEVECFSCERLIELRLSGIAKNDAEQRVKKMCETLLVNSAIEDYRIVISDRDAQNRQPQ